MSYGMANISDLNIPDKMSTSAAAIVADLLARYVAEPGVTLTRNDCVARGRWSLSTQLNKEKAGHLLSILDGVARRVTVRSFYQHLVDLAIASHPLGGPAARARPRQTKSAFRRKPHLPNEAQLAALQRANTERAAEARARRGARREPADLGPA